MTRFVRYSASVRSLRSFRCGPCSLAAAPSGTTTTESGRRMRSASGHARSSSLTPGAGVSRFCGPACPPCVIPANASASAMFQSRMRSSLRLASAELDCSHGETRKPELYTESMTDLPPAAAPPQAGVEGGLGCDAVRPSFRSTGGVGPSGDCQARPPGGRADSRSRVRHGAADHGDCATLVPGGLVIGLDRSEAMLRVASKIVRTCGVGVGCAGAVRPR